MLDVVIKGNKQLDRLLKNTEKALDPDDILEESGAILLNRIRTRYLDEVSPSGENWEKSQAALARKASGKGGGTLFASGKLFHSLQFAKKGKGVMAIYTDVPYARKHQEGLDGMVKRIFLGFNKEDAEVVQTLLKRRVRKL